MKSLDPWFISGFVDGEASFIVSVAKNSKYKSGWNVKPKFQLALHNKDASLLIKFQQYFGVGKIYKHSVESIQYRVESVKELEIIINHFDNYPLISQKWADYILFKQYIESMKNQEHLTMSGLEKLISLKTSLNLGLSKELVNAFPQVVSVDRPTLMNQDIKDPMWIAGFVSAEGSYIINIKKSSTRSLGYQILLRFQITQHTRDRFLLSNILNYLDCGHLHEGKDVKFLDAIVNKIGDINDKIIPFFMKYPIQGVKVLDFEDFKKAAELMKTKEHLTENGLAKIQEIKLRMNKGRDNYKEE